MQSCEGVFGIKDRPSVLLAQVFFDILASERSAAADDGHGEAKPLQILQHILHFERGLDQQSAQANSIGANLLRGGDDGVRGLLDAQIDDAIAVVRKDDVHEIFADVVHVALDRGQHHGAFAAAVGFFHLRFKIRNRGLHHRGRIEHRRQLHLARAEEIADGLHAVEQNRVNQFER